MNSTKKIFGLHLAHIKRKIFCAKAHQTLKKKIKNLITIIIPRHVNRGER